MAFDCSVNQFMVTMVLHKLGLFSFLRIENICMPIDYTTMALRANFGPLDLANPDQVKTWLIVFDALAPSKGWMDAKNNHSITNNFMVICGLAALEKIQYIVLPHNLQALTFMTICTAIETYLQPSEWLTIAECTKFYATKQHADESISDFIPQLCKVTAFCNFNELCNSANPTKDMIKVTLMAGLNNNATKEKVLEHMQIADHTVPQIQAFIQQLEQLKIFVQQDMAPQHIPASVDDIHYAKTQESQTKTSCECQYCGKQHPSGHCPAYGKRCTICNKMNHFSNICRSAKTAENPCYHCFRCGPACRGHSSG